MNKQIFNGQRHKNINYKPGIFSIGWRELIFEQQQKRKIEYLHQFPFADYFLLTFFQRTQLTISDCFASWPFCPPCFSYWNESFGNLLRTFCCLPFVSDLHSFFYYYYSISMIPRPRYSIQFSPYFQNGWASFFFSFNRSQSRIVSNTHIIGNNRLCVIVILYLSVLVFVFVIEGWMVVGTGSGPIFWAGPLIELNIFFYNFVGSPFDFLFLLDVQRYIPNSSLPFSTNL